jgi:hypothetical protein
VRLLPFSVPGVLEDSHADRRITHSGGLSAVDFSIDGHELTIIEADGVSVEPRQVNNLVISVAQVGPTAILLVLLIASRNLSVKFSVAIQRGCAP